LFLQNPTTSLSYNNNSDFIRRLRRYFTAAVACNTRWRLFRGRDFGMRAYRICQTPRSYVCIIRSQPSDRNSGPQSYYTSGVYAYRTVYVCTRAQVICFGKPFSVRADDHDNNIRVYSAAYNISDKSGGLWAIGRGGLLPEKDSEILSCTVSSEKIDSIIIIYRLQ